MKYSKKKQKCRTDSILDYLNMFIPIKRTCCVTLKNLCSNFPLRLYCIKVHFSGCDDAACIGFTNALDLSSSHCCQASHTLHENTITLTHGWHSSDVKRVKTQWTGKSHQHRSSCQPPLPHSPAALHHLPLLFSFFFFFLKLNLSHGLLPLLMRDGRRERWAICTTLSWIVLRCLAVAAVTDDRLRSFACVFTPPKKQRHKRSGRERWDTTLKQKKKKEKKWSGFQKRLSS